MVVSVALGAPVAGAGPRSMRRRRRTRRRRRHGQRLVIAGPRRRGGDGDAPRPSAGAVAFQISEVPGLAVGAAHERPGQAAAGDGDRLAEPRAVGGRRRRAAGRRPAWRRGPASSPCRGRRRCLVRVDARARSAAGVAGVALATLTRHGDVGGVRPPCASVVRAATQCSPSTTVVEFQRQRCRGSRSAGRRRRCRRPRNWTPPPPAAEVLAESGRRCRDTRAPSAGALHAIGRRRGVGVQDLRRRSPCSPAIVTFTSVSLLASLASTRSLFGIAHRPEPVGAVGNAVEGDRLAGVAVVVLVDPADGQAAQRGRVARSCPSVPTNAPACTTRGVVDVGVVDAEAVLRRQGDGRADAAVGRHRVEPEGREREVEVAVRGVEDEGVGHAHAARRATTGRRRCACRSAGCPGSCPRRRCTPAGSRADRGRRCRRGACSGTRARRCPARSRTRSSG